MDREDLVRYRDVALTWVRDLVTDATGHGGDVISLVCRQWRWGRDLERGGIVLGKGPFTVQGRDPGWRGRDLFHFWDAAFQRERECFDAQTEAGTEAGLAGDVNLQWDVTAERCMHVACMDVWA